MSKQTAQTGHSGLEDRPVEQPRSGPSLALQVMLAVMLGLMGFGVGFGFGVQISVTAGVLALCILTLFGVANALARRREWARARLSQRLAIAALEASAAARAIVDGEGEIVFANQSLALLCGAQAGDSLDRIRTLFTANAAQASAFEAMIAEVSGGVSSEKELRAMSDGGALILYVSARPIDDLHYQLRLEDITSRREMETVIEEERAKLVDFMDSAPIGFFSVDQDGRFQFANRTFARWLGMVVGDLTAGEWSLHDMIANPPGKARPFDLVADGGAVQRADLLLLARGGESFPANIEQVIVPASGDEPMRTRAVVRHLGAEQEWQSALRASEQRFQRLFSNAPVGIALISNEDRIAECNAALARMLHLSDAALTDHALLEIIDPDEADAEKLRLVLAEARQGRSAAPVEVAVHRDPLIVAQLHARPLGGPGSSVMLHFIDLTEQKNLERQFAQSQKMQAVGQLAGGVAHDFNNLLTAMLGFCDLLLLRHRPGDPSFSDIMQIKQNVNRAANLVRQLLAFSRQQTLQPKVLDVTDVLSDLAHLLRRLIGENITLEMVHGRDLGLVKVDHNQLEQVLINLVVNARDAMKRGGQLTIRTSSLVTDRSIERGDEIMPPGRWLAIEVADTGTGIPPEIRNRIFEPFFSTKEVGQGTGLGLSTVYGIVRQTGGFIFLDSEMGKGTRFTIHLPVAEEAGEAAAQPAEEQTADITADMTGAGLILLVEDEDAVRMFSARALGNIGYRVIEASSGEIALEEVEKLGDTPIDLVISDVVMPEMDGPSMVAKLREQRPSQRVLFMSGYTEDRFEGGLETDEATYFLPKPFSLKQLAAKVKDVIGTRSKAA